MTAQILIGILIASALFAGCSKAIDTRNAHYKGISNPRLPPRLLFLESRDKILREYGWTREAVRLILIDIDESDPSDPEDKVWFAYQKAQWVDTLSEME